MKKHNAPFHQSGEERTGRQASRQTHGAVAAPKRKSAGGMLVGVFIGLVIGVLIAFVVVWILNKSPLPFQNKYEGAPKADKAAAPSGAGQNTNPNGPIPLPGKPGDKALKDKQRFEFYGILEGKQPPVQGAPGTPATPATGTTAPPATPQSPALQSGTTDPAKAESYYLQAGAFQKSGDAERLKAKLALSGLEANIQEVVVPDKGTMQRVRVGPFRSPEEMNRARTMLAEGGVQATVVKQKE